MHSQKPQITYLVNYHILFILASSKLFPFPRMLWFRLQPDHCNRFLLLLFLISQFFNLFFFLPIAARITCLRLIFGLVVSLLKNFRGSLSGHKEFPASCHVDGCLWFGLNHHVFCLALVSFNHANLQARNIIYLSLFSSSNL